MQLNRRTLLAQAFIAPALFGAASTVWAQNDFWSQPRSLWMQRRTERGIEDVNEVYFFNGQVSGAGYLSICRLMRDVRAKEAVQMSIVLLDVLCGLQGYLRAHDYTLPLVTTSGFRNSTTNGMTEGAARNSMHTQGRAWDGRMPGITPELMARIALYLQGGGVGLYQNKNFLHVDDGRLRFWRG